MPIQPHDTPPPAGPAYQYAAPPPAPPAGYVPVPAPPPVDPPKRRKRWPFVIAGVVVILGAGAGTAYAVGAFGGSTKTVDIQITDDVSGGCVFNSDATVTLKDEHGTTLGATQLGNGTDDGSGGCSYDAKITGVPDNVSQYTETNDALGGTVTISHAQLAGNNWVFPVTTYRG